MNKRLIFLILAALMVLPTAACGSDPGAGADTTEAPAETAAPVAEAILKEHVHPDFDFYGVRELRRVIMEEYVDEHGVEMTYNHLNIHILDK